MTTSYIWIHKTISGSFSSTNALIIHLQLFKARGNNTLKYWGKVELFSYKPLPQIRAF